jgi:kynurenine formamidase
MVFQKWCVVRQCDQRHMSVIRAWYLLLLGVVLLATTCSQPPALPLYTLVFTHIVDLSHVVRGDMPHAPGIPLTQLGPVSAGSLVRPERISMRSGTNFNILSVHGTHGTLPLTIDQLTPYDVVAPAVVLDVRDQAQDNASYRLHRDAILTWEQQYGPIPPGAMVLIATGWDVRWGSTDEYLNLSADQVMQVPEIGADAATLLQQRQVRGVGLDAPVGPGTTASLMQQPGGTRWFVLENLTNVEQLPPTGTTLVMSLFKVQGSTASSARVLSLVP